MTVLPNNPRDLCALCNRQAVDGGIFCASHASAGAVELSAAETHRIGVAAVERALLDDASPDTAAGRARALMQTAHDGDGA